MSQTFTEGHLTFEFPDAWQICRPGETSYYVRHFQHFCTFPGSDGGCKEMDFLAYDPISLVLWLVEVKDYRAQQRTKPIDLADEIALKVRDSLALLRVAPVRDAAMLANGRLQARDFARASIPAASLRVVLHCEIPAHPSRLFPGIRDSANLQQKLSTKLRQVDPHAVFVDRNSNKVPWVVH
jgi:hypothetical protein